jgi:hypothetical protein
MTTIRLVIEMDATSEAQAIADLQASVQDPANEHKVQVSVISTETRIS